MRSIVIGTAGHIDHGKTALVRALTGVDTDRLPEEKRRGITIDLGFASMEMVAPDGSPLRISFVDVPGHALFIRNMLAGAGCVPAVMLVIAADEGVMPQTREHLAICQLLGIADGFTVISKADLVSQARLNEVRERVSSFLEGTFLEGSRRAIVSVSARTGMGIAEVRSELTKLAVRAQVGNRARPVRLPIDRTFIKKGFGTVVTGTLLAGNLRVGQSLVLEPGARSVRVRGLQTHGESEETAQAGSRVAVNLSGVDAAESSRGQTLIVAGELPCVDAIDAEVHLLPDAPALKHRARVHLHAFTSEVMATVLLYDGGPVKPGTPSLVRLKLAAPVVLAPGDRFVLRQPLPAGTVGGGRVLDALPVLHERRSTTHAWLRQLAHASDRDQALLRIQRRGWHGIRSAALAREMGSTPEASREITQSLSHAGEVESAPGELWLSTKAFREAAELLLDRLKGAGAAGLKRSELRSQTRIEQETLDAVADRLVKEQKAHLRGEILGVSEAPPPGDRHDARQTEMISAAYLAAGLGAPSVPELVQRLGIAEAEMRWHVTLLLRQKVLVRMGSDDAFVHAQALRQLQQRLSPLRGKPLDVAAFKLLTGLTRKHAIPLLEYLDRERITRKQGDQRLVL